VNLAGGMDGGALAHRARELRPGLPIMYTSGRQHPIALDPVEGSMFVHKPYDFFDLGRLLDYLVGSNLLTGARKAGAEAVPVPWRDWRGPAQASGCGSRRR